MTEQQTPQETQETGISAVVIHLLKGILFRNQQPALWNDCVNQQAAISDYLKVLGLSLALDDNEGYAWLVQKVTEDEEQSLPRLMSRRPLSYSMSLLCVLLRKKMAEADKSGANTRVIVARQDIINSMLVFMPDKSNEAQTAATINATINKVLDLGFLRKLKNDNESLEVQRIISALVDADWVADFNEKLTVYQAYADAAVV